MKKSVVDKFQFSVVAKKIVAIFNDNKNHKDGSLNKFLCGRLVIDMKFLILKVAIGGPGENRTPDPAMRMPYNTTLRRAH